MRTAAFSILLGLALISSRANAEEPEQAPTLPFHRNVAVEPPPIPPLRVAREEPTEHYGLWMVPFDVGAFALWVATLANADNVVTAQTTFAHSVAIYSVVPPVIHILNGEPIRGVGSFGMRVVAPLGGAVIAYVAAVFALGLAGERNEEPSGGIALAGATLGSLCAAGVDDFLIARHRVK